MPTCVVKCCSRSTLRDKKEQGITFHRFPKEIEWRKDWIDIIRECRNQIDWNPTKSSVVCSDHFETSDLYTTKGGLIRVVTFAVPQKFLWKPQSVEQQHEQPAVSETKYFEVSLETHAVSNEQKFKWHSPVEEVETDVTPAETEFEKPLSIQYTPKKMRPKKIMSKKDLLILNQKKEIKFLNQKIRRLKNRNSSLRGILRFLTKNMTDKTFCDCESKKS